jgi:2-polyprenyl-3-methyl-5-hydroxy-6-metoxy-1,4-benzoquinol methylase
MQKEKNNEELVKELYETYPYPNRKLKSEKELMNYVKWVSEIFGEKKVFWKGKRVLELGCGTGELANALGLCGAKVTAIDFSSKSIKIAKEMKKKFKNKNVDFFEKNILDLNLKKKFDVVIALGSLHHTINARKSFRVATKHCKEKGLVIIGLYNKFSRFRHRLKRIVLFFIAGNNIEKRIFWGKKLFGGNNAKSWLADKYGQVHESYHSINEIMKWFDEEGFAFISSKPSFSIPIIDEISWFLNKKAAFFVMIGAKVKRD